MAYDRVDILAAILDATDWDNPPFDPFDFPSPKQCDALSYVGSFLKMSTKQSPSATMGTWECAKLDDIIADLPAFLEMATYEDPVDDLATFFENACLWACSKMVVDPDGTFYMFVDFPKEIRMMIWEECIPSQIHLVAENVYQGVIDCRMQTLDDALKDSNIGWYSDGDIRELYLALFGDEPPNDLIAQLWDPTRAKAHHNRDCKPAFPTGFRQKFPVIGRVNREARKVAQDYVANHITMKYNLAFVHIDMQADIDHAAESQVWLNRKTDTVLINTQYVPPDNHPPAAVYGNGPGGPVEIRVDRLFGMVDNNMIKTAILAEVLATVPTSFYYRLVAAERIEVVVMVLNFSDLSDTEAATTDLFGHFGEESMALIPANNNLLLRKLFTAHAGFGAEEAFDHLSSGTLLFGTAATRYRPSNFNEYREEMQAFAWEAMTTCMNKLADSPTGLGELYDVHWANTVRASFPDTFQPVILAHRCQHRALIDAGRLAA